VEIIGLGLVTDGQGGMAAASVSLSRAAKLRKRVILSARPARPAGSRRTFFMDRGTRGGRRALSWWPSRSSGEAYQQQRLYWLDYDPVAFALLVIGMGMTAPTR
jgi:hypothetical protein